MKKPTPSGFVPFLVCNQSHFEDTISITQNGINVLGVPIGNEEWTKIQLNMMAEKYKEDLNKIV